MIEREILPVEDNIRRIRELDKIRADEFNKVKLNKNKKKRKKIIISLASLVSAAALIVTGILTSGFGIFKKRKVEETKYIPPKNKVENIIPDEELKTDSLDNLGVKLEFPKEEKKEYNNPTGNVNVNNIVKDNNGTLWVSPEAEAKQEDIGKVITDTDGGTLEKRPDGDVYEKQPSYEITDKDGNIKDEGKLDDNGIPDGYAWDPVIEKIVPENEVGKYVKDEDGNLWLKEDYEAYLREKEKSETTSTEVEIIPTDPVIVEDVTPSDTTETEIPGPVIPDSEPTTGNYYDEISGLTFQSKEHYDQWVLQDFEGYGIVNGIMVPKTDEMIKADQKVLTK